METIAFKLMGHMLLVFEKFGNIQYSISRIIAVINLLYLVRGHVELLFSKLHPKCTKSTTQYEYNYKLLQYLNLNVVTTVVNESQ